MEQMLGFLKRCGEQLAACPPGLVAPEILRSITGWEASSPWKGARQDGADPRPSREEDEDNVCSRDDQVVSRPGLAREQEAGEQREVGSAAGACTTVWHQTSISDDETHDVSTWWHLSFRPWFPQARARVSVAGKGNWKEKRR